MGRDRNREINDEKMVKEQNKKLALSTALEWKNIHE
jgi:hypothetical protein